jgi:hypothetical protein
MAQHDLYAGYVKIAEYGSIVTVVDPRDCYDYKVFLFNKKSRRLEPQERAELIAFAFDIHDVFVKKLGLPSSHIDYFLNDSHSSVVVVSCAGTQTEYIPGVELRQAAHQNNQGQEYPWPQEGISTLSKTVACALPMFLFGFEEFLEDCKTQAMAVLIPAAFVSSSEAAWLKYRAEVKVENVDDLESMPDGWKDCVQKYVHFVDDDMSEDAIVWATFTQDEYASDWWQRAQKDVCDKNVVGQACISIVTASGNGHSEGDEGRDDVVALEFEKLDFDLKLQD